MVRIHDLKRTFGRRMRAARVQMETRKVLLGHKSGDITTHYSGPEIEALLPAASRVCGSESRKGPALVVLRKRMAHVVKGKVVCFEWVIWWLWVDSNHRPQHYENGPRTFN